MGCIGEAEASGGTVGGMYMTDSLAKRGRARARTTSNERKRPAVMNAAPGRRRAHAVRPYTARGSDTRARTKSNQRAQYGPLCRIVAHGGIWQGRLGDGWSGTMPRASR